MLLIRETDVTIMVQDMDRAIAFYEKIGLTVQNRWGNNYTRMVTKGINIGLHPGGTKSGGSGTVSIGFMVDDINEARSLLDQNNIGYKSEDGKSGKFAHFNDLDATILYFMQPAY